jgi:hypothetical protein
LIPWQTTTSAGRDGNSLFLTASPSRADEIFLEEPRSRIREFITLVRVMRDFVRGFRVLHFVGPCVTVFGSARIKSDSPYYELARKMGAAIAQLGFTVMTGGGLGIMEAANRGAKDVSGRSVGCNIELPHEQKPNGYLDRLPADELDVRGTFVVPRVIREGAGAALVAVRNEQAPQIPLRFAPPRVYTAVTAVARFTGRKCEIEFIDPLATETVNVSGRSLPSQADLTAPIALGLSREHPEKIGFAAMLNPEKFAHTVRLIQVQPYDPNKIPVVFVHGLQDTPVAWVPMVNALWADPALRRNYQVCVFS